MPSKDTIKNQLTVFTDGLMVELRTIIKQGEPYFSSKDVCHNLGLTNHVQALKRVDEEDKTYAQYTTTGGKQRTTFVNESGLYQLIFMSRREEAVDFRRQVTREILPSIRKTGKYALPAFVKNEDEVKDIQRMVDKYLDKE